MEIDKPTLIELLEAFVDATEVLQRQLMLHQMLFSAACRAKGLDEIQTQKAVEKGWETFSPKIGAARREEYVSLVAKIPLLVDMLESNRDAAFRLLKEWNPKGKPN